jgi:hypothetical protein
LPDEIPPAGDLPPPPAPPPPKELPDPGEVGLVRDEDASMLDRYYRLEAEHDELMEQLYEKYGTKDLDAAGWTNEEQAVVNKYRHQMSLTRSWLLDEEQKFLDAAPARGVSEEARRGLGEEDRPRPTPNDQISLWQRAAHNAAGSKKGAGEPDWIRMVRGETQQTLGALEKVRRGVQGEWPRWQPIAEDAKTRKAIMEWYETQLQPGWNTVRTVAAQYGEVGADKALINYNNRRGFDVSLNHLAPYHYWYTRAGQNWLQRFMIRPGILAQYVRAREAMRQSNREAGRRQRFEHMIKIPFPWLPDEMGDAIYIDPISLMLPMSNMVDFDWMDETESQQGLSRISKALGAYGVRPYHFLEYPFKMGWLADAGQWFGMDEQTANAKLGPTYKGDFPYLLPTTGLIKAGTAAMRDVGGEEGWIPPGGVIVEEPIRRAAGLPRGEIWDAYRTTRWLTGIAAQDPENRELAHSVLIAHALVDADEKGYGRVWEPDSEFVQKMQLEYKWTDDEVAAAQELIVEAMQGSAKESGVRAIGRFLGPRMAVETTGERAQIELKQQARGEAWNWENLEGSYANYAAFRRRNPALLPYSTQYATLPGDPKYATMSPADRANWMKQREEKDYIIEAYREDIDAALREKPWDTAAIGVLKGERRVALDEIEAKYPILEDLDKIPSILYGMSPDEMWTSVVEAELDALEEGLPSADTYKTPEGEIDWDAYNKARDSWEKSLPQLPNILAGDYKGMTTLEAMHTKWSQGHSIMEALAYTYDRRVAQPAWSRYNKLVAAGQTKSKAWDKTAGKVAPMRARELVPLIQEEYPDRWTDAELRTELAGVEFPPLEEQGGEEREALSEFWDLQAQIPGPAGVRDDPAVQIILNERTRDTVTPEQVDRARRLLSNYLKRNPTAPLAKQESKMLHDKAERRWPGVFETESAYFDQGTEERKAFLAQHPELKELWDFRAQFRKTHPAYNKYYPKRSSGSTYEPYWTPERLEEYDQRFQQGGWRGVFGTPWQERKPYLRPPP